VDVAELDDSLVVVEFELVGVFGVELDEESVVDLADLRLLLDDCLLVLTVCMGEELLGCVEAAELGDRLRLLAQRD
jgi:hypothetical protein